MEKSNLFFQFTLIIFILTIYACSENLPEPQVMLKEKDKEVFASSDPYYAASARSFTGRDSLQGIAFKSKVTGNYIIDFSDLAPKMILEGDGKATHLAHVKVFLSHNIVNENTIEDGEINYKSAKGDEISGTYEGKLDFVSSNDSYIFTIREEITSGTGRFDGVVGVINTSGILNADGSFSYSSDGWLSNTKSNKNKNK